MRFYTYLLALFLTGTSAIADPMLTKNCPPTDSESHLTINNQGNSTYKDNDSGEIIKFMVKKFNIDLSKPILDAGAGFGTFSYELVKLGAKEIYINDLSPNNLACLKQNISLSFPENKTKIHYIEGDISNSSTVRTIPRDTLGLIYAKHVIHFFTAPQIFDFFTQAHNALEKNGILFLIIENPYLAQQEKLIDSISNTAQQNQIKGLSIPLDEIVQQQYNTFDLNTNHAHCSAKNYKSTPKSIRTPGFPCLLESIQNGVPHSYQLLKPELVAIILEHIGFNVLGSNNQNDLRGTITLIAQKR